MTERVIEFDFVRRPHPLLIPSIIFKILRDKEFLELKFLRLVCSQWDYEASTLLSRKTHRRLATEQQVEKYLKNNSLRNRTCNSFEFGAETILKSPIVQRFFTDFGNIVKSLKLHSPDWSNGQLWELLSSQLPNLEELSLRIFIPKYGHLFPDAHEIPQKFFTIKKLNLNFCIDHTDVYFTNPIILKELFVATPNLETLSCPNWPTIILPSTNVSTLVFNVILAEPEIKFDRLSNLQVTANLSNTELESLVNKKFPLKELRMEISASVRGIYLQWLLSSLENTLTTLSLTFPHFYETWPFEGGFPRMRNLKFLSLLKYQGSLESVVEKLPALTTLSLTDVTLYDGNPDLPEDDVNKGAFSSCSNHLLEELNIQDKNDSPNALIKYLVKLFPYLKRLRMENVKDAVLRCVFAKLAEMEELVLQGDFTDSGVTGIPLQAFRQLMMDDSAQDVDNLREYSYVGDLKNLTKLVLDSKMMTYLSIRFGVKDCKNLSFQRISSIKLLSLK